MPIKFGNLDISSMSFGSLPVDKLYFGSQAIYESGPSVDPVLENNDWATIKAVCEAGLAADYWAVGDTKTDAGTDGNTRTFRIVDMQGLYNKHVVFESVTTEANSEIWNAQDNVDDNNCSNNWNISNMRTVVLPATLLKYSSGLQSAVTETTIQTAKDGGDNKTLISTTNKLFLAAEKEWYTTRSRSWQFEFNALTTYNYWTIHTSSSEHIKYNPQGTAVFCFFRSPQDWFMDGYTYNVCGNHAGGGQSRLESYRSYYFVPCFSF